MIPRARNTTRFPRSVLVCSNTPGVPQESLLSQESCDVLLAHTDMNSSSNSNPVVLLECFPVYRAHLYVCFEYYHHGNCPYEIICLVHRLDMHHDKRRAVMALVC